MRSSACAASCSAGTLQSDAQVVTLEELFVRKNEDLSEGQFAQNSKQGCECVAVCNDALGCVAAFVTRMSSQRQVSRYRVSAEAQPPFEAMAMPCLRVDSARASALADLYGSKRPEGLFAYGSCAGDLLGAYIQSDAQVVTLEELLVRKNEDLSEEQFS